MRLDHIAYRVKDRYKTAQFFKDTLGSTIGTEFQIQFDDDSLLVEPSYQELRLKMTSD